MPVQPLWVCALHIRSEHVLSRLMQAGQVTLCQPDGVVIFLKVHASYSVVGGDEQLFVLIDIAASVS